ncbi:hypothetical protein G4O51_01130 [Candidatus Bathyarchaeota archaeon A05DMB-2]|jgi:hypothetical protein|nr:hypothetical protein [Candidatus Bathyarchaeota archaeon A05DMB-2]
METVKKLLPTNREKRIIIVVIAVALALNAITFALAYPGMFEPSNPTLERDFSAYYNAGWRLYNNPSKIYVSGPLPGDYPFELRAQTFKYVPSFLLLISPFLLLSYQDAFIAFNLVQLALMPVLAFFVYKLVEDKNLALAILACIVVLINPLPSLPLTQAASRTLYYRFTSINPQTFSWSYYWGYVCGNAHVLQPVFLVGAMYFGFVKKPWLSGLMFALSAFDPRFALLALPLIAWYNRKTLLRFVAGSAVFLSAMNLPFFFYHGIGFELLRANASGDVLSQMYAYDWIPLYAVLVLGITEVFTLLSQSDWKLETSLEIKFRNVISFFRLRLFEGWFVRCLSGKD